MSGAALHILIPNFPSPDGFVDNVAHCLQQMGHRVTCAPRPFGRSRRPILDGAGRAAQSAFPQFWTRAERWAVAAARALRPDVLLCMTQALRDDALAEVGRLGIRRIAWWGDPPANMRTMGLLSDEWDAIHLKDRAAVGRFRALGLPAQLTHEAMNPDWHCPQGAQSVPDVAVVGNFYGYRQALAARLAAKGVPQALYGPPLPRWGDRSLRDLHRGTYLVKQQKSQVFEGALACLNSTSLAEGDSLNCRAFEICGAGGLQLIEDRAIVADCFAPDHEVLTYRSIDDILGHLDHARSNPGWARNIRAAGLARASAEHTYQHRLTRILEAA
ncbi:MAG: glycosyltransferase [Rhodobacteraceae bacterium]|nr:glycosyltransferase [Paracoccaceae bacterium]